MSPTNLLFNYIQGYQIEPYTVMAAIKKGRSMVQLSPSSFESDHFCIIFKTKNHPVSLSMPLMSLL